MTQPLVTFPETLAPSVLRLYQDAFQEFWDWCTTHGLSALPAGDWNVTEFLRWYGWEWAPGGRHAAEGEPAGKSAISMKRALMAIIAVHKEAGEPLDARAGWALVREREAQGSPRGPGRPRLDAPRPVRRDPLTEVRDAAAGALMATGAFSAQWLAALGVDEVAVDGDRVETWRGGVRAAVTDPVAAETVADWLEALGLGWGAAHGPLFPRIRRGKVTGESLLAGEITRIAAGQET